MSETKRKKIIETVKKLIVHQQSAGTIGNREEAEAFASKVVALMRQYRIERHEVEPSVIDAMDFRDYGMQTIDAYPATEVPWQAFLFQIIAEANACQCVIIRDVLGMPFFIAGQTTDRAVVIALSTMLVHSIERLEADAWAEHGATSAILGSTRTAFGVSYRTGFLQALQHRLAEEAAEPAGSQELIAIGRAVVKTERYLATRLSGNKGSMDVEIELTDKLAAQAGYADGMAADLEHNRLTGDDVPRREKLLRGPVGATFAGRR